jgi:hypothetical protein
MNLDEVFDYTTDEERLLAEQAALLNVLTETCTAQTAMLGKLLERLTEIRVILQSLADRPGPSPTSG